MTPAGRRKSNGAAEPSTEADEKRQTAPRPKRRARIIASPEDRRDPEEIERERLLARVLAAEGRQSISKAADDFAAAGFDLPNQQDVWLQLLEHQDEARVVDAIGRLTALLDEEEPARRAVLESRLRRIEELADEHATQQAAAELRRLLAARHAVTHA